MVVDRRWKLASLGASVAVVVAVGAFSINAAFGSAPDEAEESAAYESAAQRSGDLLGPYFDELSVLPGFVSGGLAENSDELEFYWNGELPAEAKAVVQRAEAEGTVIKIVQVLYSYDEIQDHAFTLVEALEDAGITVNGFGPNRAHDTIELLGPVLSVDAQLQQTARAIAKTVLPDDIALAFLPDEGGVTFEADRMLDEHGMPTEEAIRDSGAVMVVGDALITRFNAYAGGDRFTADGVEHGFAGVRVDPLAWAVDVYWVGPLPADAQAIVDDAPEGVTVRVHEAKYTLFEMFDAMERIPLNVEGGSDDLMITARGPEADGSGVWIEYIGTGSPELIRQVAEAASGVDITTVEKGEPFMAMPGRL